MYDKGSGEYKNVAKSKKEIKEEFKSKGVFIRGHCDREKMEKLAADNNIELTSRVGVVKVGWMGKPKGLLQVLWERGGINENNLKEYSLKGKGYQMDEDGNLKEEFQCYNLRTLMSNCANFKEEKSAMEVLLQDLSTKSHNNQKIELLVSLKYHCELAGKGVEYVWLVMKKHYHCKPLEEKNTKKKFEKVVREAAECAKKSSVELFAA